MRDPEKHREYNREWARKSRATPVGLERSRAAVKRWQERNPEKAKAAYADWYARNGAAYHRERQFKERRIDNRRFMLANAKQRAKRLGVSFTLQKADIVVPEFCPILSIKLEIGTKGFFSASPSLDRFDPVKGYTKENVRVISYRANCLKRDGTLDEFRKIVAYMERG